LYRLGKVEEEKIWRQKQADLRDTEERFKFSKTIAQGGAEPSSEANRDPAPTRHAPSMDKEKVMEKSKYEAAEIWKSPKGGRFT
jgi:hypothetical protein